ncbi:alpha/beta hydrolase [Amycolatopsis sp. PS_44_ISF1]|nr:alpha/beta hydrolase [Amycolatopsis sp. PS_44_ISF1]
MEVSGPADAAVTLVLVHGWTQDHRTWDGVVSALGPAARVVRYDLRGHGGSGPARGRSATIPRLADDLAELIAARVPSGPIVLAGHSMGGMTVMALAERHPELVALRVAGAAFVATSSGQMDRITLGLPGLAGEFSVRFERRLAKTLAHRRGERLPLNPAVVSSGARFLVFGNHPRRADVRLVAEQLLCAHPASLGEFQDAISTHDRRVALAALRGTPTVVLAGEKDRLCPLAHAKVIADELPDAEFVRYPGAGHMLPLERSGEVAVRIGALVRAATPRTRP